jgi:hypothetical protein
MATAIVKRRVVTGWRSDLINAVLDACSSVPYGQYLHIEVDFKLKPDSLGRLQRKWNSKAEKSRVWKVQHRDIYLRGKELERERMKLDYQAYCLQYLEAFPGSMPASYRGFSKLGLAAKWRKDPKSAVISSHRLLDN